MLAWRLIFAAAFLLPLAALLVIDYRYSGASPGIWLVPLAALVAALAAGEMVDLISVESYRPSPRLIQAGAVMIILASAAPAAWGLVGATYPADCPLGRLGWPLGATALAVTTVFVVEMVRFNEPGGHLIKIAMSTLTLVYVGLFLSFLYPLRTFHDNQWGMSALLSLLLIVKMSDVGAYTIGKLIGRTKLVPRLSPGKTVEGAVGGIVTAALTSWVFFAWAVPALTQDSSLIQASLMEDSSLIRESGATAAWRSVLYGLILALAAIVGDLAESLMKRDMQRKDSSGWLRGLGGILDLLDSVVVAAPAAYLCWSVGLIGPSA